MLASAPALAKGSRLSPLLGAGLCSRQPPSHSELQPASKPDHPDTRRAAWPVRQKREREDDPVSTSLHRL